MRVNIYNAYDGRERWDSIRMDAVPRKDEFIQVGNNTYMVLSVLHITHVTDEGWQTGDNEINVRCQKVDLGI